MASILRAYGGLWGLLALVCLGAWSILAFQAGGVIVPALCSQLSSWTRSAAGSLNLILALNPPGQLAAGLALMLAAMMAPLIAKPLRQVGDSLPAGRRARAMLLFAACYFAVWMAAAAALQILAILLHLIEPRSLQRVGLGIALAVAWQISPVKRLCLEGCRRPLRPMAGGGATDRDAMAFGLTHGVWCVGACWALMLLPFLTSAHHVLAMAAVQLILTAERFEWGLLRKARPGIASES